MISINTLTRSSESIFNPVLYTAFFYVFFYISVTLISNSSDQMQTAGRETSVSRLHVGKLTHFFPTVPTFAIRETASLGIMGEPRVPPLNPSETIVF